MQDDDRALLGREGGEGSLDLIPRRDARRCVGGIGNELGRRQLDDWPAAPLAKIGQAHSYDQAIRPRLEATGIAQAREVGPDRDERNLRGVVRRVRILDHAVRGGVQAVGHARRDRLVGIAIAMLCALDQRSIHRFAPRGRVFARLTLHGAGRGGTFRSWSRGK